MEKKSVIVPKEACSAIITPSAATRSLTSAPSDRREPTRALKT